MDRARFRNIRNRIFDNLILLSVVFIGNVLIGENELDTGLS
jgi:hypothetical protein